MTTAQKRLTQLRRTRRAYYALYFTLSTAALASMAYFAPMAAALALLAATVMSIMEVFQLYMEPHRSPIEPSDIGNRFKELLAPMKTEVLTQQNAIFDIAVSFRMSGLKRVAILNVHSKVFDYICNTKPANVNFVLAHEATHVKEHDHTMAAIQRWFYAVQKIALLPLFTYTLAIAIIPSEESIVYYASLTLVQLAIVAILCLLWYKTLRICESIADAGAQTLCSTEETQAFVDFLKEHIEADRTSIIQRLLDKHPTMAQRICALEEE